MKILGGGNEEALEGARGSSGEDKGLPETEASRPFPFIVAAAASSPSLFQPTTSSSVLLVAEVGIFIVFATFKDSRKKTQYLH